MFHLYLKTLQLILLFCLIFVSTHSITLAQCEGVYFKTISKKVLTDKVVFRWNAEYYQDMTGDGKTDFVGFLRDPETKEFRGIYILPGDGADGFGTPIQIALPNAIDPNSDYLRVSDFNFDGKKDFFVRFRGNPGTIVVYRNDGNGVFTPLAPSNLPNDETIQHIADINGDSLADIFTFSYGAEDHSFYRLANPDGTFGSAVNITTNNYDLGDFNNDGKLDVAVINGSFLQFYYNQGNGVFIYGNVSILLDTRTTYFSAVKDLNNDGKADLVFTSYSSDGTSPPKLIIVNNLGNNNFTKTEYPISGGFVRESNVNDFNGDGFLDIIAPDYLKYSVFTNDGTGVFIRHDYNGQLGEYDGGPPSRMPVGDLDGDNKTDFLRISNFDYNDSSYSKVFDETQLVIIKNVCNQFGQTKFVDFEGDGHTNFALWRESDGRWNYARLYSMTYNWGMAGDIPAPGDYDGDGKTDFAVYRPSDGFWYIRNSSDNSFLSVKFGAGEDKPVPADYNGDGLTDFAVYRPSNGTWYILTSDTYEFSAEHFGASEDKPVPEDYDGDDKTDFAVFRPSTGVWYYLKSSDGNSVGVQWGTGTDTPVPGDYDGDGKADITVVRGGGQSYWYILRSFNQQYAAIALGTSGDVPQTGDWNGDGILDLAMYHASNSAWYLSTFRSRTQPFTYGSINFGSIDETPISRLNRIY